MTTDKELDALVKKVGNETPSDLPDNWNCIYLAGDVRALLAAISALRKERDRLREALEKVVSRIGVGESTYDALVDRHDRMQTTALEALGLAPQEPTT